MRAYSYDPDTLVLAGEVDCDPSPLDPESYLVPAYAVTDAPPMDCPAGEVVFWTGERWATRPLLTPTTPAAVPAPPTDDQVIDGMSGAVQSHLDAAAAAWGYDGIISAASYADEPAVPQFAAEGTALRAWRSVVWARCYALLAEVRAGQRPRPTVPELLAALPAAPERPRA